MWRFDVSLLRFSVRSIQNTAIYWNHWSGVYPTLTPGAFTPSLVSRPRLHVLEGDELTDARKVAIVLRHDYATGLAA
jgi:hypothetical protein